MSYAASTQIVKKLVDRFKFVKAHGVTETVRSFANFLTTIDEPKNSDINQGINFLIKEYLHTATPAQVEDMFREEPELRRLYNERYDPDVNLDNLATLPAHTLGHQYARFIRDNKLVKLEDFLRARRTATTPIEYLVYRAYKVHDILHVVLGCDPTDMGEVRIVSYSCAQSRVGRAGPVALGILFLHIALKHHEQFGEAIALAKEWYDLGLKTRRSVVFRYEDHWHDPVDEVRRLYFAQPSGAIPRCA